MITSGPIIGTGLHAVGGISASTCYLPFQKIKTWSWGTFWLVQASFAWIIMPLIIGVLTVPDFFSILTYFIKISFTQVEIPLISGTLPVPSIFFSSSSALSKAFWAAFLFGIAYGFGGMSFGLAIRHIGYSLTYTIAIGISAVLGTIIPLMKKGELINQFQYPGGNIVLIGMIISIIGVGICGFAGFKKEKDISTLEGKKIHFNMLAGLILCIIAGILSGVFNVSLEEGQPISDMAREMKAGIYEGNAKLIVSTSGCFIVNFIWFLILGIRQKTLKEFTFKTGLSGSTLVKNFLWSAFAGSLWCLQFFFYGLGHVKMGGSQYVSWVLHMSMLIFFSYIVGVMMKEWKNVKRFTYITLIIALLTLVISFLITAHGSVMVEKHCKHLQEIEVNNIRN